MALSVALVTPFAWSQPHDVNEHVEGLARELRARGHRVTVLAPSNRARDLAAGRRARTGREGLLPRLDALLATSEETAAAAGERFPGRYELVPIGVDLELHAPGKKQDVIVLEWRQSERPLLRALVRELGAFPDWQ